MILVVGNGESRKDININNIPMKKVGCNAIYRDFYSYNKSRTYENVAIYSQAV